MVRLKNRYILFELLHTDANPEQRELLERIRAALQLNFGTLASGQLAGSLNLKYYSQRTGKGILQADRAHFRLAWAALTFLELREGGFARSLGISGTVKKAEQRLISVDRNEMFLVE